MLRGVKRVIAYADIFHARDDKRSYASRYSARDAVFTNFAVEALPTLLDAKMCMFKCVATKGAMKKRWICCAKEGVRKEC